MIGILVVLFVVGLYMAACWNYNKEFGPPPGKDVDTDPLNHVSQWL